MYIFGYLVILYTVLTSTPNSLQIFVKAKRLQYRQLIKESTAEQGREAPGNVRQRHSGLAIVSSDVRGVTRVYPPSIFRSRKLRLAALIVGLQGFYFIPGPRNPTIKAAKRYFGDHFRVHLVRNTRKNTRSISVTHERKWRFAQKLPLLIVVSCGFS